MSNYKIGIYNKKVESSENLKECDIIIDNFEHLKNHVRKNDKIIYISDFSFFDYNLVEFIELVKEYELMVYQYNEKLNEYTDFNNNFLALKIALGCLDYIKSNIDIIKKLL